MDKLSLSPRILPKSIVPDQVPEEVFPEIKLSGVPPHGNVVSQFEFTPTNTEEMALGDEPLNAFNVTV
jgi:hypothetical protein